MGDYRTTAGEAHPKPKRERRSKRRRILSVFLLLALTIAACLMLIRVERRVQTDGYATSRHYAEVRPAVAGTVHRILHASGETVQAGEPLVQLDDASERAALRETENQLRKAQAELELREAELAELQRQRRFAVDTAEKQLAYAKQKLQLTRELNSRGLTSGRAVSEDTFALEQAKAKLENLRATDATLDGHRVEVLRRELDVRRDAVDRARVRVKERQVCAPISGRLNRFTFYEGELVQPGNVLFEVFGGRINMLKLSVPERYATQVATNQPCRATLRTYSQILSTRRFEGKVEAMRSVIQSRNGKTYRIIYCSFDDQGLQVPPGTTADAYIHVGEAPLWSVLLGN